MKIRHKILLGFLPIALLSVVTMTLFSQRVVRKVLVEEVTRRGLSAGLNLSLNEHMSRGFLAGDEVRLLPVLQQVMSNAGALYAIVLDPEGRVLAHTNVAETGKIYQDAATLTAIGSESPERVQMEVRGQLVVDVAFPVWEREERAAGEEFLLLGHPTVQVKRRLGTVRLGLPLQETLDTAGQISTQVLWIITLVTLLTICLILFYTRALLRPVGDLALAAERIGRGQVGETVAVHTGDEMAELAASFNQMSQDLAMTTVSRDFLDRVLRNMQDLVIVTNADGTIRLVNQRVLSILQLQETDLAGQPVERLFPADQSPMPHAGQQGGMPSIVSKEAAMLTGSGRRVPVLLGITALGDAGKPAEGFVITAADITERKQAEESIRASLGEKELLLKEIHHRVKNNLQIISSLLNLQASQVDDASTLEMFTSSQNRIASMALIHERLYRSHELARVDFFEYVKDLTDSLFAGYQGDGERIRLRLDVEHILLGIDEAIPCGLIINELVLNALKHAFPDGRNGTLHVSFASSPDGDVNELVIGDDGVGLPPGLDLDTVDSLGVSLVAILVKQLGGSLVIEREAGTTYRISLPVTRPEGAPTTAREPER